MGEAVRRLRLEKRLSLQQLAALSGVSVGMLSQIERDLTNPSLKTMTRIRVALDVPLSALFGDGHSHVPGDPDFIRRADRRPRLKLGRGGVFKELLSSVTASPDLQFMFVDIPPQEGSGEQPLSYTAEKGGLVIEGELLLRVDEQEVLLREGDSFQFDGLRPHTFTNSGSTTTRLVWIIVQTNSERHL